MKKEKKQTANDCNECTNSFRVSNKLYCSTKVISRDKLFESGRVGTAYDCPFFRVRRGRK